MRCKACHYSLQNLTEPRCPECGRAFDPDDPNTFEHKGTLWFRPTLARACLAVFGLSGLMSLMFMWFSGLRPGDSLLSLVGGMFCFSAGLTFLLFPLILIWTDSRVHGSRVKARTPTDD